MRIIQQHAVKSVEIKTSIGLQVQTRNFDCRVAPNLFFSGKCYLWLSFSTAMMGRTTRPGLTVFGGPLTGSIVWAAQDQAPSGLFPVLLPRGRN